MNKRDSFRPDIDPPRVDPAKELRLKDEFVGMIITRHTGWGIVGFDTTRSFGNQQVYRNYHDKGFADLFEEI